VPNVPLTDLFEADRLSINYDSHCCRDLGFPVTGHFHGEVPKIDLPPSLMATSCELNAARREHAAPDGARGPRGAGSLGYRRSRCGPQRPVGSQRWRAGTR